VSETGGRPVRADARRNRDRLLEAAVRAFASGGADVTLDAIAKTAGIGIGTLYRHFPTREALVEAAYRQELARLCDAVPTWPARFAPSSPPVGTHTPRAATG
jgi:AcrR family transcriptional regulator